jgi:hypothetical protein
MRVERIEEGECEFPDLAGWTEPGWYFWNETLTHCHGPYATEEEAIIAFSEYCEHLESQG